MDVSRSLLIRLAAGCFVWLAVGANLFAEPPSGRLKVRIPEEKLVHADASDDYKLSSNDVVHIKVFQEEELETTARIAKNGTITMPLIKNPTIGGLTRQRLETHQNTYDRRCGSGRGYTQ